MRLELGSLPRLGRDAKLIVAASCISAVSFFGVQMLLKVLYILRLGYGPEYVGVFNASSALAYMLMGIPSGMLGGRFGSRKAMLIGGITSMTGMVLLPLSEYVPQWAQMSWPFVSQVVLTTGWSLFNVNLVPALMAASTAEVRDAAYAFSNAARGLGMFVGTLFGGVLPGLIAGMLGATLDTPAPYRYALWVGSALAALTLIPLSMIRVGPATAYATQAKGRVAFPLAPIALMVGYVYVRHAGWATCQSFCNAYMDTDLRLSAASIGFIAATGQILAMVASLATPRLAARRSNGWTLVMTTLGTAIFLVPLAVAPHWTAAGLGRVGILILSAIWMPALQVFQMEMVDSQSRSLAYGVVSMAMGLGFGTTSLVGGYVIASAGYRTLFWVGAVLCTLAAAMMLGIWRWQARRQTDASPTASSPARGQTDPA